MDVKLVVQKGTTKQQTWHLHHQDTVVGRHRTCDLRILSSEVSRRHCLLHITGDSVNVEDLDSINGTFVNGSRVAGRQMLRPGDQLEIGPMQFLVEFELPPGQAARATDQADEGEAYDVLPLAEEVSGPSSDPANPDDEPMAVLDDEGADWNLPQADQLREFLSQLEQPDSPRQRKR
jgi:pSer/pThr/pTyr-binding forkhead associated (FHA) protein